MSHLSKLITIRTYHCDGYGHMNNARYLELYEEARWQYIEDEGILKAMSKTHLQFFVVNVNVDFKRPAIAGDHVQIKTTFEEYGRKSITLKQEMSKGDTLLSKADLTFVLFDEKEQKSVLISDEIKNIFKLDDA